ncbi:MAG: LuxR C-terminal-related transcriptional regulator [Muribaculaceae bacterium]|nr:LuxR C-terminal-related transcriptional regulator [Muribaculaceae bacterium]
MAAKGLLYTHSFLLNLTVIFATIFIVSCSHSEQYARIVSDAEHIVNHSPDSALTMLEEFEPSELKQDSTKAKYFYVVALAHARKDQIALSDSSVVFSSEYYRGKDLNRSIRSTTLLASYKFHMGETETARKMLDSLLSLPNISDTLLIMPLRYRIGLFGYEGHHERLIRKLMSIDNDKGREIDYKLWLYFDLVFEGKPNEALDVIDSLIEEEYGEDNKELSIRFRYEKVAALMDMGRYQESIALVDSLLIENTDMTGGPYLHLWKSLGLLNMRNRMAAEKELATADSLAVNCLDHSQSYFNSFATVIHTVINYEKTGALSLIPFAQVNNPQRDNLLEEKSLRENAARQALETEKQRLILKAKSDRQTSFLVITILVALLISGILIWYALNKKRRSVEVLERNEVLQKLVDEAKSKLSDASVSDNLRRAMLQQLGIIKMVAETPTEQNREMLRRLSSIENDTDGALVNWNSVYEIIDNLYAGFYTHLHSNYGALLSDKEKHIIILMIAGFSTKEISVITSQTMATVYTRKSTIRRKLGVPEKDDILAFIRRKQTD